MDNLFIAATQYTPEVTMNTDGIVAFKGKSYPENTFEFYRPVMAWLETFVNAVGCDTLRVEFEIVYFNSSSSKFFFGLFDFLKEHSAHKKITIIWCYDEDNESALEAGEDFIEDFPSLNIQLKTIA
jgi:hypothetical protein